MWNKIKFINFFLIFFDHGKIHGWHEAFLSSSEHFAGRLKDHEYHETCKQISGLDSFARDVCRIKHLSLSFNHLKHVWPSKLPTPVCTVTTTLHRDARFQHGCAAARYRHLVFLTSPAIRWRTWALETDRVSRENWFRLKHISRNGKCYAISKDASWLNDKRQCVCGLFATPFVNTWAFHEAISDPRSRLLTYWPTLYDASTAWSFGASQLAGITTLPCLSRPIVVK